METSNTTSNRLRVILPIGIIALSVATSLYFTLNPPIVEMRGGNHTKEVTVETVTLEPKTFDVEMHTQGTVLSSKVIPLVAKTSGTLEFVSDKLRTGEAVEAGEVLWRLQSRDFVLAAQIAQADLSKAELELGLTTARSEQAKKDWKILNGNRPISLQASLMPQLKAAQDAHMAAKARLEIAYTNLAEATVIAPFAGKVSGAANVQVGQVFSQGAVIGELFSDRDLHIRLPLAGRDLSVIQRVLDNSTGNVPVRISHNENGTMTNWDANLEYLEAKADPQTRKQFAVAALDLAPSDKAPAVGSFASAVIYAEKLDSVFVLPAQSVSDASTVQLVSNGNVQEKPVEIVHSSLTEVVVSSASSMMEAGDRVITTPSSVSYEGLKVMAINTQQSVTDDHLRLTNEANDTVEDAKPVAHALTVEASETD